jgi:hypothetical protein
MVQSELLHILRGLLNSDVGQQTMHKLQDGQGINTDDGKVWLKAAELCKELSILGFPVVIDKSVPANAVKVVNDTILGKTATLYTEENTYIDPQGVVYDAVESPACYGCYFDCDIDGCDLADPCAGTRRTDSRSIIWVKREVQA